MGDSCFTYKLWYEDPLRMGSFFGIKSLSTQKKFTYCSCLVVAIWPKFQKSGGVLKGCCSNTLSWETLEFEGSPWGFQVLGHKQQCQLLLELVKMQNMLPHRLPSPKLPCQNYKHYSSMSQSHSLGHQQLSVFNKQEGTKKLHAISNSYKNYSKIHTLSIKQSQGSQNFTFKL